jgi:hypothetical protein
MDVDVTIEKGRHHSVTVHSYLPAIDFCISADQALDILRALKRKEAVMMDMAHNYYDCSECGQTHPKSVRSCDALSFEDEGGDEEDGDEF